MVLFYSLSIFLEGREALHQALYRKWRPQSFSDVCGQDHITAILRYEVENHKTSHAYLFTGSRGTGKTTCAKILAKAVNCESPDRGNPCGKCAACLSADLGSCIDIVEMDAASNNGVDDIRQIRDEVEYLPAELKFKVYIIDEVHMLSASAFNALLKTLEEPPPHVMFILATTELQKIPATILSRCQRFDFRRIAGDVIAARLEHIAEAEGITLDHEAAFMLAHLAQGGMRDAISLLELCSGENKPVTAEVVEEIAGTGGRDVTIKLLNAVCDKDYDTIFAEIGKMFMSSRDLAVFWQDLIAFYRDMLVVKTTKGAKDYLDLSEKQLGELMEIAGRFAVETLIYHTKLLDEALISMRMSGSSKRLTAEMTLVRMCDERFSASNEALASRLTLLEDKLKSGAFRVSAPAAVSAPPQVVMEPEEEAPAAPIEKEAPKNPDAPVKKEYRQLPYWPDFVQKCCERDQMLGSLLRGSSKGFTVNTDEFLHIRTSNKMALTIITNMFSTMLEVLNTFEDGRLDSSMVKLEYAPEKKEDKFKALDDIARNAEE
ncbi:MAG: DNA polymerase III subunit gamma/tau [Ruminococcaceae bacterium]|nr:DNA polymerase III subunit gamma/tau [Oscillospiraceae bacterium]